MSIFSFYSKKSSFKETWSVRSEELLYKYNSLLSECNSVTVYGCGPKHTTENQITVQYPALKILSTDMVEWDETVTKLDLNYADSYVSSDVGILLGVMEYLNEPSAIFRKLRNHHEHVLISYSTCRYPIGSSKEFEDEIIQRLNSRWVNHLSFPQFVESASEYFRLVSAHRCKIFENQIFFHFTSLNSLQFN